MLCDVCCAVDEKAGGRKKSILNGELCEDDIVTSLDYYEEGVYRGG